MSKFFCRKTRKRIGAIVVAVGLGILLAMLIPFWGWIVAMGCVIIGLGWKIMEDRN
ncbi:MULTISPECIES: hypothetical protein [unclassified Clostridium]|uniref:hypothetical protein n=1 Tax=unclassified Clostridium TaxID=2614128 RepID=UPI0025C05BE3|nr:MULTISPECIES: hypothetical protein [unclassified Clostridium]